MVWFLYWHCQLLGQCSYVKDLTHYDLQAALIVKFGQFRMPYLGLLLPRTLSSCFDCVSCRASIVRKVEYLPSLIRQRRWLKGKGLVPKDKRS